ncbi:Reverse transcriptase (RNA-dependent DNA polymerase) [Fragilaria crotonensis]|nr:Reverse transcriptase (RNA-dependent DNA polymerase) [Fragilaria crotonensis]
MIQTAFSSNPCAAAGPCILAAFTVIHARLVAAGLRPQLQRLDNECSEALKSFLTKEAIKFQLVPPKVHRRNAAERAIRTFKNHFVAGLCSVDKDFPLHLWDKLLPQAELTLNLLRGSRINPKLSAHAQMHGHFDFNQTPIAPPGIRVLVHIKPTERTTWSPHGADGWYTGPALESYRCYTVWLWETRASRICDTLVWFPTKVTMPIASSNDLILAGIGDIIQALRNPSPVPLWPRLLTVYEALLQLTRVLTTVASPPQTIFSDEAPTRVTDADKNPVAPLRVEPQPLHAHSPEPPLRVDIIAPAAPKSVQFSPLPSTPRSPPLTPTTAPFALHGHAINPDTGKIAEYRELSQSSDGAIWENSNCEEIGRLAQGYGAIKGTNTIHFIRRSAIPHGRKAAYLRVVSAYRPEKANPHRVRWTVGATKLTTLSRSAQNRRLDHCKIALQQRLVDPRSTFLGIDLKDFYLGTPMDRYEYMRVPIWMLPAAIVAQYNLTDLFDDGFVYVEIRRGMYGLPQAGRLANDQLVAFLQPHGYMPCPLTHGLWRHTTRDVVFSLVVDDFGVRYTPGRRRSSHCNLKSAYEVSIDWTGARYCGLTLKWDYEKRTCDISMPGYIERALLRFQHIAGRSPEHSPHPWQRPNYGAKTQFATLPDATPTLDAADKTRILEVLGTLLFYARAIDSTMLTAIGELATEQSQATTTTMEKLSQLLNYCAAHPDATVRFTASDMILAVESDASYLSVVKGRSRAAGYFFLTNKLSTPNAQYRPNGAVHVLCHIMREVLSSAAEAELGALFHNGKYG